MDNITKLSDKELLALRDKLETDISTFDTLQKTKKVCLNSAYGVLANEGFRFFEPDFAEAITLSGQLSIKWAEKKFNIIMNKLCSTENIDYVIACDTDSAYLNFSAFVEKHLKGKTKGQTVDALNTIIERMFKPYIEEFYNELHALMNGYNKRMKMKREYIADRGVWTGKKRYILNVWDTEGVRNSEPEIKVTGIEAVRSSTPEIIRKKLKESFKVIMNNSEKDLHLFIKEFKAEFVKLPFETIASPKSVHGLDKYSDRATIYTKGTPMHVRAALLYNYMINRLDLKKKYEYIKEGEKLKYCYLKLPNPCNENVIACSYILPPEFGLHEYIDYETQFEKTFLEPIRNVIKPIGWSDHKKASLDFLLAKE